jgi:hypothetical protein
MTARPDPTTATRDEYNKYIDELTAAILDVKRKEEYRVKQINGELLSIISHYARPGAGYNPGHMRWTDSEIFAIINGILRSLVYDKTVIWERLKRTEAVLNKLKSNQQLPLF